MGTKRVGLARMETLIENLKRDLALGGATVSGDLMNVEAKTASFAPSMPTDSGKFFTTTGASGAVTVTLPTPSSTIAGSHCYVYNTVNQNLIIVCATNDLIVGPNDVDLDNYTFEQAGELIGAAVHLVCDGSKWLVMEMSALSEGATTTTDD